MADLSIKQNTSLLRPNLQSFKARLTVLNAEKYTSKQANSAVANSSLKSSADEAVSHGQFDRAIYLYNEILKQSPYDQDANLGIAKAYTYSNKPQFAIPHLTTYTAQIPDDLENITLLGECLKKTGRFSEAIAKFKSVLAVEPNYDYAKRNLADAENLQKACWNPTAARQERYDTAIKNLTEAVKIAKEFFPKGYMDDMKDIIVTFDKTAQMGGRSNIAQYEHSKRKISITDDYLYANPKLTGAYLVHEFVHGKDNDPYTSVREEQDAYRVQAKYWTEKVKNIYDPEMDYVADLYKQSVATLDKRVEEIYRLRDPQIASTSYNHPPSNSRLSSLELKNMAEQPLRAYEIIV